MRVLRLSSRAFSQKSNTLPKNQMVDVPPIKEEKDPDFTLLIRNYISTYDGKEKIIKFIDEVEYYDKNPDVKRSEDHVLELKNDEVTQLVSFIFNNLNRSLCDIFFYTCKYIIKEAIKK